MLDHPSLQEINCSNEFAPYLSNLAPLLDTTLSSVEKMNGDTYTDILRFRNQESILDNIEKIIKTLALNPENKSEKEAWESFYYQTRKYLILCLQVVSRRLTEYTNIHPEAAPEVPALFYTLQIIKTHTQVIQNEVSKTLGKEYNEKYIKILKTVDQLEQRKDWIHARDLARTLWTNVFFKKFTKEKKEIELCDIGAKGGEVAYFLKEHAKKEEKILNIDLFDINPQINNRIEETLTIDNLDICDTQQVIALLKKRKGKKYDFINFSNVFHKIAPGKNQLQALHNLAILAHEICIISPDPSISSTLTMALSDDSSRHCGNGSIPSENMMLDLFSQAKLTCKTHKSIGHKASLLDAFGHKMYIVESHTPAPLKYN